MHEWMLRSKYLRHIQECVNHMKISETVENKRDSINVEAKGSLHFIPINNRELKEER